MILDARQLEDEAVLQADVCIAGGGAAGITLARALRGSGLSVILLEGGSERIEDAHQAIYQGRMTGLDTWSMDQCRFRALGGSTLAWAGWCHPLDPEDFEVRDWMPGSGWPISYADLAPWYARAHGPLELGPYEYDANVLAEASGRPLLELDPELAVSRVYHYSAPTRFGARYRDELAEAEDLRVYLHANLTRVVLEAPGGAVSRFEGRTLEGTRFSVEAGRFVLALGGIENARLLLASNTQQPEGVANGSDHVGRHFMEHPHYYNGPLIVMKRSDVRFYEEVFTTRYAPEGGEATEMRLMGALALPAAIRDAEQLPHAAFELQVVDPSRGEMGDVSASTIASLIDGGREIGLRMNARIEQRPLSDARLTLQADNPGPTGLPRLDLNWQIAPEDTRGLKRTVDLMGVAFGAAGLGRVWTPADGDTFRGFPQPGCHHMGSTRMSALPEDGVVNADCRAHEVDNLYLAGSSVYPTGGFANPTLTLVALALRLADHLRGAS